MISPALRSQLLLWRDEARPDEACGWLLRCGGRVEAVRRPHGAPPGRFLLDPRDLLALPADREFVGVWHTHPSGRPEPSTADHATAAIWPGTTWAIVAEDVTLWTATERGLAPCVGPPAW